MHTYVQRTGFWCHDGELFGIGYSGSGDAKNSPIDQSKHNHGPIPCGFYEIQPPQESRLHGLFVLPLAPNLDNQMFGRNGFLIHGDSIEHPGTASEGCIVIDHAIRQRIWETGDTDLEVIAQ